MTERKPSDDRDYPEGSVGRYVRERWGAIPASPRPYVSPVAPPAPRSAPAAEQQDVPEPETDRAAHRAAQHQAPERRAPVQQTPEQQDPEHQSSEHQSPEHRWTEHRATDRRATDVDALPRRRAGRAGRRGAAHTARGGNPPGGVVPFPAPARREADGRRTSPAEPARDAGDWGPSAWAPASRGPGGTADPGAAPRRSDQRAGDSRGADRRDGDPRDGDQRGGDPRGGDSRVGDQRGGGSSGAGSPGVEPGRGGPHGHERGAGAAAGVAPAAGSGAPTDSAARGAAERFPAAARNADPASAVAAGHADPDSAARHQHAPGLRPVESGSDGPTGVGGSGVGSSGGAVTGIGGAQARRQEFGGSEFGGSQVGGSQVGGSEVGGSEVGGSGVGMDGGGVVGRAGATGAAGRPVGSVGAGSVGSATGPAGPVVAAGSAAAVHPDAGAGPMPVAPAGSVPVAPADPMSVAPAGPASAAPGGPGPVAPAGPGPVAPGGPGPTAPAGSMSAAPAGPASGAPGDPIPAAPGDPIPAAPGDAMPAAPGGPGPTAPAGSASVASGPPTPAAPAGPAPGGPIPTAPAGPMLVGPVAPGATDPVPMRPVPATAPPAPPPPTPLGVPAAGSMPVGAERRAVRWTDPGAVAAQEAQRARSSVDGLVSDLSSARLLRPPKRPPQSGWRRMLYLLSGRLINPGEGPADLRRRLLTARVNQPLHGSYKIAMLSLKGGVGKTTITATLGATFASLRGDRVVAVDANPDRGTLSQKIPLETSATVRHLLRDAGRLRRYSDVRSYTSQGPSRLEVLASEQDPAVSEAFSEEDYRRTVNLLEHFYNIVLTDCGTGLMHSAMYGVLGVADQLIIVSSGSIDGARSASATMDWLDAHGHGQLVRNSVTVINCVHRSAGGVDLDRVSAHFAARCRAVVQIPFDAHLEEGAEVELDRLEPDTRLALLELAAAVADAFDEASRS